MEYNKKYFINKFEIIPEEKWIKGKLHDEITGQSCALGHCGVVNWIPTEEASALMKLFGNVEPLLDSEGRICNGSVVYRVNDKNNGLGPKTNVLNHLNGLPD